MTSQPDSIQPPRIAAWLVNLFSAPQEAESILGDLHEEFSDLRSKSGDAFARRWYWLQSVKTIAHLVAAGFRVAPWSTSSAIAGGFFLMRFAFRAYQPVMTALLDRYLVYEHYPRAYLFCLGEGNLIGHVVVAMLVGAAVALVSKGREMTATTTLALISSVLPITATLYLVASGKHLWFWMLPWSLASSLAFVVGGLLVRTRRSATQDAASIA
jgi:hypothetical protein